MTVPAEPLPILYSFRRCPYAMRARLTLLRSNIATELREVKLKEMPKELLLVSPKGTVPVLILADNSVLEESRDIMHWALEINDPDDWLPTDKQLASAAEALLDENDFTFKPWLDKYKYADRYPDHTADYYRNKGEEFLQQLESRLQQDRFLLGSEPSTADIGIFPFIRQYAFVDLVWFEQSPYPELRAWLTLWIESPLFAAIMKKYTVWEPGDERISFP